MNGVHAADRRALRRTKPDLRRPALASCARTGHPKNQKLDLIRTGGAVLTLAIMLMNAPAAPGTTLARMSLGELASAAEIIARVRCTGSASRRDADSIWTYTDFSVEETFKGAPGAQITIRLPGGRDGHAVESVEGAPRFAAGDEAIIFLERTKSGDWSISAWAEGTFRIARDPRTGEQKITQDSSGIEVFDPATRTFRTEGIARMPLAEFRTRLEGAMRSAGQ